MKIYTRTGDDGTTGLFGAGRVEKHHPRIRACGAVDETNAALGMAIALVANAGPLAPLLRSMQEDLFVLGADLATPFSARAKTTRITAEQVTRLESVIDTHEADLAPLKTFILPGGTALAAALHFARTICRRAERELVLASETLELNLHALHYLNRLSDLLFVLARWANRCAGIEDIPWDPQGA